jgi:hypothetical protein
LAYLHCFNRPTFQVNDTLSPSVTTSEIVLQGPDFIIAEIGGGMLAYSKTSAPSSKRKFECQIAKTTSRPDRDFMRRA